MSIDAVITEYHEWFVGEDKTIAFHVKDVDGIPLNITAWTMAWALKSSPGTAAIIDKTTIDGIAVVGAYDDDPTVNTQRAVVTIADSDTDDMTPGEYIHALKRTDDGFESVLANGTALIQQAAL